VRAAFVLWLLLAAAGHASAQVQGHVSLMFDALPDLDSASGNQHVSELRARVFAERADDFGEHLRIVVSGYVDGLVADRASVGGQDTTRDVIVRPADVYADLVFSRFDVRVGAARIVWGRLDEFQPTDVVSPIDLTRFLFEGRTEARLATGLVRGRVFLPRSTTVEAIVVPAFRASRFDQLDERTSPFNLPGGIERREPGFGIESLQGGARITSTLRRVDWGASAYRGVRSVPVATLIPTPGGPAVVGTHPRFTMVGGDFETVRGAWGVRGEAAAFIDHAAESFEGGVGLDRRAGAVRVGGNVLWSNDAGLSLVAAADRSFARETRTVRLFTVYDPGDRTVFVRGIAAVSLHENTWLEGSAGVFTGSSLDTLGQLARRDFFYARLKVFF